MKAKPRILRHLRRYKTITIVLCRDWGLINLHARIGELIKDGNVISRDEKLKIYSRGKFIKQYTKYRLIQDK